jgi:Fungalysin metallopeptidase (M36)
VSARDSHATHAAIAGRLFVALGVAALLQLASPAPAAAVPAPVTGKLRVARGPVAQLEHTRTEPLPGGGAVYRFQQRIGGTEVLGAETIVNDPPGGAPQVVVDTSRSGIHAPATPAVARDRAILLAERSLGLKRLRAKPRARLAIAPGAGDALTWRILVPAARPLGDFQVLVDAASGAVLSKRNLIRDLRGRAKLFVPNAVAANGGNSGLSDDNDRNSSRLTRLRVPVTLRHLAPHQRCLDGEFAKVLLGHDQRPVCKRDLNWSRVKRANDKFEALMAYYHIDREQSYVQSLGFDDIDNRRQVVFADRISEDNSFYSPFTRKLTLGTGGVDDGEDADVTTHEYGHSIQDAEAPGFLRGGGLQPGSLAEGSADYMAAVMSAQAPGTTNTDDVCIFDWDGQTWGELFPLDQRRCGRRADNPSTLAAEEANQIDCSNPAPTGPLDIHCVGTVWSSALWKLRGEIGAGTAGLSVVDRDLIASQMMYTSHETFQDAANALLIADGDLYGGTHQGTIEAEMVGRGFCPEAGC